MLTAISMCVLNWLETYSGAITAVATIFIGLFTFTLWRSTKKLWNATNSAVALARSEFNASHRPKIRVKHVWLKKPIEELLPVIIDLVIVNTGDTPAIVTALRHAIHIMNRHNSLPARIMEDDNQGPIKRKDTLEPGITLVYPDLTYQRNINHEEFPRIRSESSNLYVVGDIEYLDGEGRPRKTAFCRKFTSSQLRTNAQSLIGQFVIEHNRDYEYQD